MIQLTHNELLSVFEMWESECRANPDCFFTAEEVAALKISSASVKSAIAFLNYLKKVRDPVVESGAETQQKTAETRENTGVAGGGQDWAGMDGSTAYWVIQRNANGWDDIKKMMDAWLAANIHRPSVSAVEKLMPDGFTPWCGGVSPVPGYVPVKVIIRNGSIISGAACDFRWVHSNIPLDVIAYRVPNTSDDEVF